ncbi:MAG: penicillin acylase family protein [Chloroflexi bacterium]|nr:penicillin acylase family protein [Chloroflexota bacterium]
MTLSTLEMLHRLGSGESIATICQAAGISRASFDQWWADETASRVPQMQGHIPLPPDANRSLPGKAVEILRDAKGIPHIFAENDADLFFGLGYAMAQDRLWQMDYFRRKACGRLAEVLGPDGLELDLLARTAGFHRIATQMLARMPQETITILEAFAQGVNGLIAASQDHLPIEFDLLEYVPELWSPGDSVAVWVDFRWYRTGRFPVIVLPELARRILGDGQLLQAFLTPEAGEESILPPGSYPARRSVAEPVGETIGDPESNIGSNNWVVAANLTGTGAPLVASDPHLPFTIHGQWYQAHLAGGSFQVAGTAAVGVPGIFVGRNTHVAWGATNNICSQRDLYQEQTSLDHPGCFLFDNTWEPAREIVEEIQIKGSEPLHKTIRFSRHGPIVDDLLPKPARHTGPVSLRWLGATFSDEISCILQHNRARSAQEFRDSFRRWRVPTMNFVFADTAGHIGYQAIGRVPIRSNWSRGYRPGWDPAHQWQELIPFEGMPALFDPPRGWICSANNRNAPEDYPYPLSGTWSSGNRARRIRHMLEHIGAETGAIPADIPLEVDEATPPAYFTGMQQDVLSLRAVDALPSLLTTLVEDSDTRLAAARAYLQDWDGRMEVDEVAASLFEVFFQRWQRKVTAVRFPPAEVEIFMGSVAGLASVLLSNDSYGWFNSPNPDTTRRQAIREAMLQALEYLAQRLGPDMSGWTYGRLHTITLKHSLSSRGDLGVLLNRGGYPVHGNLETVCNSASGADFAVVSGAVHRSISDLAAVPSGIWSVDAVGTSGHPGSPHYCDQLVDWLAGNYQYIPLERKPAEQVAVSRLVVE